MNERGCFDSRFQIKEFVIKFYLESLEERILFFVVWANVNFLIFAMINGRKY